MVICSLNMHTQYPIAITLKSLARKIYNLNQDIPLFSFYTGETSMAFGVLILMAISNLGQNICLGKAWFLFIAEI